MFTKIESLIWCFGVVVLLWPGNVFCDYENQPKIIVKNGDLVLEAAYDRNITLRLTGDSSVLLNNLNLMEKVRQHFRPAMEDSDSSKQTEGISVGEIKTEIQRLHDDLERFALRLITMQNRTRRTLQLGVIRRNLGRINRLNGRLLVLERKLKKDECTEATETCKNGGTCYDSYNAFHCECTEGYTGKTCEDDVDECYLLSGTDLGCQNNAVCINTPGSYKCNCAKGFSGTHCRLRNAVCHQAQYQELCAHGTCVPANNKQGYTCICEQGWTRNNDNPTNTTKLATLACDVDVNECEESSNPCHSECINLPGSFKCGPCPAGYTGNGVTCLDIDECKINNGGCSALPKVRCINTEGSYFCANCPPGWVGDGRTCEPAPSNSCDQEKICHPQAKCEYISDVASCTCPPGMFGHGFGPRGCHTNPLTDSCANHICQNNGTCISNGRTTSCICPNGYSGALCETGDGCHPNPCQNEGSCKPLGVNGFKCSCIPGTTGKHCEVLRNVCAKSLRLPSGELKYPSDDEAEYSLNERCAWIIRTSPTQILNVTFSAFDVEESEDCSHDWLQIHDGNSLASQLIGRFCGKGLPLEGNILSSHHLLFFWFRSDNATNRPGFRMSWVSQPHICGESLELSTKDVGVIKSPGYPGRTPANRECQWQLSAPYGYRLVIRIYDINLGLLPNCTGDTLLINDADLMLKRYCQTSSSDILRSSSNKISLHLHTDRFSADSSFQLHYEVEPGLPHCGGLFTEPSGYIIGPSEQATCLYLIQQPPGTQIKWEFLDFKSFEVDNCNLNQIEFFDGKTDEDSLILTTCGGKTPEPVISSTNYLLVRYKNSFPDEAKSYKPIKAKYSRVCEFRVFGPDSGVLSTPNYPKPYVEEITCTFRIYGPGDTVVIAYFIDFDIAETATSSREDTVGNATAANSATEVNKLKDESISYVDIFLSSTNKRRFHKGTPMVLRSERNIMTVVFHATTNTEKARGLQLEYSFQKIKCGGIYVEDKGSLYKTADGEDCVVIFEAPQGKHIKLDLEYTILGEQGEFLVYANQTSGGGFLLKNVTKSSKIEETFNFNIITLVLKYRVEITGSYQFLNTAQACGGNFSSLYGAIVSPSWPRAYQANMDCVWIITAPLGNKVELQVHNFTLEPTCSGDKLEIRNGMFSNSPLIGRYCAGQIPSRLVSFANSLYIRFTTDNFIEGPGFYFNWEQTTTGCGGKLTSYKGSVHTPHLDQLPEVTSMHDVNMICDWQIVVSQGSSVDLTVTTATDEMEFCHKNNLKIHDGSSNLSPLLEFNCSGLVKGERLQLKSSSNQLLIIYTLTENSKHVTPEFIIDYVTNCKAVIENHRGIIESPNFPENYPENQNCAWDLKAGRNNKLKIIFSHLSLEASDMMCDYDYVEVWDMKDMDILKKYHICTHTPEPILSEGNRLVVHFVTDYSYNKNGFRAEYSRVGCGEHMNKDFGSVIAPNYPYSNDLDCDWFIEVEPGRQIVLVVTEFHLESENPDCNQNALYFKESKNSSIVLARECHEQQIPLTVTSPGNRLYVHFHTSPTRSRKYFKGYYQSIVSICGGSLRGTFGLISSPNYQYTTNAQAYRCVWDITVPESYGILLNFKRFQLSTSPNCTEASMEFYKVAGGSSQYLDMFCGADKPNINLVHGNHLRLEYKNSGKQNTDVFSLEYGKLCGGLITSSSGYIKSLATEQCIWELDLKPGTLISLTILQMDCYCRRDNTGLKKCENGLGFKENHFDENLQSGNYTIYLCENHQTDLVFEASKLHIFANNINLRAKYSTAQYSCGGTIESAAGSLASPYYPSTYPSNIECTWMVLGTKGSFLELQFDQFDIVSSEHCNEDYLEIRDWSEGKILGVFCGSTIPLESLLSYERFWLKFHSADGNAGKGFKLSWNYVHLNELNMTKGYIANPPLKMVKNVEEPYAWRIVVPRGQFIQLNFEQYNSGLELFDGFDQTALSVDIAPSPWRFVSSSNVVYLQTDNENIEEFILLWNTTTNKPLDPNATLSKCHSEEFIKVHRFNAIRVFSPGYPRGYESELYCDWIFKPANPIEHVAVAMLDVDLETTSECSGDYLKISTSADLMTWHKQENLCNGSNVRKWGKETPFLWVHGTPNIKMEFVSDWSVNRTGFMAKVVAKCGSNMTDSVGFIDGSMFNDFNDGPNSQCIWHINVKPGKRINVRLDYPRVELNKDDFDDECSNHALLYDGVDDHAPLILPGKLCFPQNVSAIFLNSTTNHLTIKYNLNLNKVSPKLISLKFWNLTYREYSECNEEIRLIPEASEIVVTSPSYPNVPHPHTECEWRIIAPQGEIIQIEFIDRFDMNSRYCSQEYLELFDGSTLLSQTLGRYCRRPSILRTTQNMLYMHYVTDIAEPRNGFKALISINRCGGFFTENFGIIKSPGYPASYPSTTQCDFVINLQYAKQNGLIGLRFIDIDLPYNETKLETSDHLEIITVSDKDLHIPPIFVYGNATKNLDLRISSGKAIIRFHTYLKSFSHRGFKLNYNSLGSSCGHIVNGVSGQITMNLPTNSFYTITCPWTITVPKKQRVRLDILNMEDIKQYNFTTPLRFDIHHNSERTSEITTFTPHTFNPQSIIQSSDNLMYFKITIPRSGLVLRQLRARYSSDEESPCPHDINEDDKAGSIDLPGLDPTFNGNFYCGIKIKLNEGETIVFNISSFLVTGQVSGVISPLVIRDKYLNTYYRSNLTDFVHAQSHRTGSISIVQTKSNRIHRLKISYKKYSCGGVVRATGGLQIKYPKVNSDDIGGDIMCAWSVEKPFYSPFNQDSGREFKLVGNFSFTESCEDEYLEIFEGQRTNQSSAFKICKDRMIENFEYTIRKSTTYIIYRSIHYKVEKSAFTLSIENGLTYSSETSVNLNTPPIKIDKEFYKNNIECSWIFYTKPGLYLQVKFLGRFFIEDSVNCSKDYLEIQRDNEGLWIPEARFCGRQVPAIFNSTSNRIQIIFRTDEAVTTEGFEFVVQTHCTRVVKVTSTEIQTIESPPSNYRVSRKMHCEYIFQGNATDKLIIVRTKFEVNKLAYVRDSCRLGSLTVNKRDDEGKDLPEVLHCELEFEERANQYLRLAYEAYTGQKFTMEYAYDSCGGNLTKPAVIRHLKHENENSYAENMKCVWYITAPPEHSIAVKFKYFSTEETYDQLNIYSGHVENQDKLVARLSGNYTSLTPIVVDSNQAIVKAFSDSSGSDKGFEANILFLANCNERISLTEGNSPLTLARNIRFNSSEQYICNYRISAPKSYRIRGEIKKLQINGANSTCQNSKTNCQDKCNNLKIFNNPSNSENGVARFCTSSSINKTFVSFYETLSLRLDASLPGQYSYEIILKMEKTECGLTEYKLGDNEKFKFNFPLNGLTRYAPNIHCTWRFISDHDLDFHFNFIDLQNKSQVTGKCMDYITVRKAYHVYDLCGRSQNFSINGLTDSSQDAVLTFHSDESEEGKGFELVVQRSDACNQTHNLLSKTLSYQSYGMEALVCNDTIVVPENYTLNFYIHLMYFRDHACKNLHFKITDLNTNKTLLDRCESAYANVNLFTNTNTVRIETSQFSRIMLDYSSSKRNLTPGCGGIFRAHKAQFSSPPYENDRNFSECRWDIIVPTTSVKTFQFYDFNMGTITNCHLDNVKIIEILPNETEKLLKTYCGPDVPQAFSSTSDHLVVVSKKSPNFDGTGWTLNYYSSNYEWNSKIFINNNQDWR